MSLSNKGKGRKILTCWTILLTVTILAAAAAPAVAGDAEREARIDRAWQRWLEAAANQDAYSTGDPLLDARVGALFGTGGEKKIEIIDFSAGVSGSQAGCASLGLVAELQEAVTRFPKDFLNMAESTVAGLVQGAPMIALAYFKPTWANYIKHMRAMINQSMIFRSNQCGALNALVDKRLQDVEAAELKKCIDEKVASGMSGHAAQDECLKDPPGFENLPKMFNPLNGKEEYRPVEYGLTGIFQKRGMSEDDAAEYARIITGITGDLVFTSTGGGSGDKGRRSPDVQEGLVAMTQGKVRAWRERAEAVLDEAGEDGPSDEALKEFATPHTRMTADQYLSVKNTLGENTAKNLVFALADLSARFETLYEAISIVEAYMAIAADQKATSSKEKIEAMAAAMAKAARTHLGSITSLEDRYRRLVTEMMKKVNTETRQSVEAEENASMLVDKKELNINSPAIFVK